MPTPNIELQATAEDILTGFRDDLARRAAKADYLKSVYPGLTFRDQILMIGALDEGIEAARALRALDLALTSLTLPAKPRRDGPEG